MPFSPAQIQRLFSWIPKTIGGVTYPAVWSDQWAASPTYPVIVLTLAPTGRTMGFDSYLGIEPNQDEEGEVYDDRWGHYEKATVTVDFQTISPTERDSFAHLFEIEVIRSRLDLDWQQDKLKVLDVLLSGAALSYRDAHGRVIYRSVTDLEIEGEISWIEQVPAIKSFEALVHGSSSENDLRYFIYVPGRVGVSVRLVGPAQENLG